MGGRVLPGVPLAVYVVVKPARDEEVLRDLVLTFIPEESQKPQSLDGSGGQSEGDAPKVWRVVRHDEFRRLGAPMKGHVQRRVPTPRA